jgi:hypothetical protein
MKKRTMAIIALVVLLIVGTVWAFSGSQLDKVEKLRKEVFPENGPPNWDKMDELRKEMEKLSPEQRERFIPPGMRERMQRKQDHMEGYFKTPPSQRKDYLDKRREEEQKKRREEMEKRRKEWEKNNPPGSQGQRQGPRPGGPPQGGGPGAGPGPGAQGGQGANRGGAPGGRRNLTPEQRAQRRNRFMDRTTPANRAKWAEYRDAMRKRRIELGLPPDPPRGPRPGGRR